MTPLEKAQSRPSRKNRQIAGPSDRDVALAVAWAKGDINLAQAKHGLECAESGSDAYVKLAMALRTAVRLRVLVERR